MTAVSLTTIRERVRQLCGLPVFTATSTVTEAAILDLIQTAVALLAAIVKERSGELYFVTSSSLTTVNGTSTVAFPAQFSDLIRLSWLKSEAQEVQLELASADEFVAYPNAWGSCVPRYRLVGQTFEFFPTPDAAYDLRVYYATGLYPTSWEDELQCRDGWDQWIALQTCVLVRARQQKDAGDFAGMLGKLEGDIRRQLKRDRFGARQIRDHRALYDVDARSRRHGRWY